MKEFVARELSRKKTIEIQLAGESRTCENIGIDTNFYDAIAKRIILTTGKGGRLSPCSASRGIKRTSRIDILVNRQVPVNETCQNLQTTCISEIAGDSFRDCESFLNQ